MAAVLLGMATLSFSGSIQAIEIVGQPKLEWYFPPNGWPADIDGQVFNNPSELQAKINAYEDQLFNKCMSAEGTQSCSKRVLKKQVPSLPSQFVEINGVPFLIHFEADYVYQDKIHPENSLVRLWGNGFTIYRRLTCTTGSLHTERLPGGSPGQYIGYCAIVSAPSAIDPSNPPICPANNGNGTVSSKPISLATGQKLLFETDYEDSGTHPLSWWRTYSSQRLSPVMQLPDSLQTRLPITVADGPSPYNGWSIPIAKMRQEIAYYGYSKVGNTPAFEKIGNGARIIDLGNGQTKYFLGSGFIYMFSSTSTPAYAGPWRDADGKDTLTEGVGTSGAAEFTYRQAENTNTSWVFNDAGQLLREVQRNGYVKTYAYNAAGQAVSITNHFGRSLGLAYNGAGQISQVTLPDVAGGTARVISYTYTGSQLTSVRYPDNSSKTYLYEDARFPNAVTGIMDERGTRLSTYTYDAQGRAIDSQWAGGADRTQVQYPSTTVAAMEGIPTLVTDALGTVRSYSYSAKQGRLSVASSNLPSGSGQADAATRVQNAEGLITRETDFLGISTNYTWDTVSRLPTQVTTSSKTVRTAWDTALRLPSAVTETGRVTAYTYDTFGNQLTESVTDTIPGTSSTGSVRSMAYTYNAQQLMATSTDPLGRVTSYSYDAGGNLTRITNALGHVTVLSRDNAGRLTGVTEPNGLQTTYGYDARGRLVQSIVGSNLAANLVQRSTLTYTLSGQVATVQLASGHAISYSYDAAQRLTGATDNRGNRISYTLDAMGNRTLEEVRDAGNALALATRRTISSLNRVASVSLGNAPDVVATTFGFDANGETISATDSLGQATTQTLDALRRPVATRLPDGSQASLAYNALDDITSAKDPKGISTAYVKNAWGEVLQETSPDSGTTRYSRDAAGNVLAMTDARGQTSAYQYDALNRLTKITWADGTTHQFSYDGGASLTVNGPQTGTLRSMTDASGTTTFNRNALGRVVQTYATVNDRTAGAGTPPSTRGIGYGYYADGTLGVLGYPSGLNVHYPRNASGHIVGVLTQQPGTTTLVPFITGITYTALGQPKAWSWKHCLPTPGSSATPACTSAARSFDTAGRMQSNEFASYQYDSAGRITGLTQQLWANLPQAGTTTTSTSTTTTTILARTPLASTIGYDNRDRVTRLSRAGLDTSYSYDANSNRLRSSRTTRSDSNGDRLLTPSDSLQTLSQASTLPTTSNRLLGFTQTLSSLAGSTSTVNTSTTATGTPTSVNSAVAYTLDAAGNLVSDGLRSFSYNAENRHASTLDASGLTTRYWYNAAGQRVFKTTANANTTTGTASSTATVTLGTAYVYPDAGLPSWALLGEYCNGDSQCLRQEVIWLPTPDGSAIPVGLYRNNRFYALQSDHLGSPRIAVDDSNRPVWQWPVSAFGDAAPTGILQATTNPAAVTTIDPTSKTPLASSTPAITLNLRYPGQYFDRESGLHFNWMRSYSPNNGRYTQADPIGLQGGWNRFAYANSNPVKYSDPTGLIVGVDDLIIGGGVLVVGCAMSPGCSSAVTNAVSATVNAVGDAIDRICKPAIPDTSPGNLCEQLALAEAKAGAGIPIMEGLGDAPRLIALYGPGPWIKKEHKHRCPDGRLVVIHYFTNGRVNVELKFK
jgi:RHS repeat-associated protein